MEVCNVKIHCIIGKKYQKKFYQSLYNSLEITKRFPSFCVLRFSHFVFNCYYNGFINVTGIRNLQGIKVALDVLKFVLNLQDVLFEKIVIDNITAKCISVKTKRVNLQDKKRKINHENVYEMQYQREVFPNMFIKTTYGTIIWSTNNIIACVGIKKKKNLKKILKIIQYIDKL